MEAELAARCFPPPDTPAHAAPLGIGGSSFGASSHCLQTTTRTRLLGTPLRRHSSAATSAMRNRSCLRAGASAGSSVLLSDTKSASAGSSSGAGSSSDHSPAYGAAYTLRDFSAMDPPAQQQLRVLRHPSVPSVLLGHMQGATGMPPAIGPRAAASYSVAVSAKVAQLFHDLDALGQMIAQWAGYELPWVAMQIEPGNMDSYERYAAAKDLGKWAGLKSAPANSFGGRLREFIAAARVLPPDATESAPEINYNRFAAILTG